MSISVINEVLDSSRSEGTARLLMVVMAEQAHEDGLVSAGIPRLARRVNTSERNIQKLMRKLEDLGELLVSFETGRGNANEYHVLPPDTLARVILSVQNRLEKLKDARVKAELAAFLGDLQKVNARAQRVNAGTPFNDSERVNAGAERVNAGTQRVNARAERVNASSPEPRVTSGTSEPVNTRRLSEPAADEKEDVGGRGDSGGYGSSDEPGTSGGASAAAAHAASTGSPAPAQVQPRSQGTGDDDATSLEELLAARRVALEQAFEGWNLARVMNRVKGRDSTWLTIPVERIETLHTLACEAKGHRYRGDLAEMLDDEAREIASHNRLPASPEDVDMDDLLRAGNAPLNGVRRTK